ncbi:MAG TPA: M20/M25/M40 family metallo-hydrolase [Bryobacteraceae bacterium]|nr:M20/M25/M40 family metallo-hydrolase [Bryobacteraceae bacterium]
MRRVSALIVVLAAFGVAADDNRPLGERTRQYLTDLVRIDTSNPPGNETKVAEYLKQIADAHGIPCELLGGDPKRLSFVARLKGSGKGRPLLLMAHSDVVPADKSQWTADPFGAQFKDGFIYGRGTQDDKSLLAAELAVMIEIKRRNLKLGRDIILLSEADEEAGSTGIEWLIQHQYPKIEAEFAINEGGGVLDTKDGPRVFEVQTTEKIPTRITLSAKGTAGHGSLPRADNPLLHLARAAEKLSDADEPVVLNSTTQEYFRELARRAPQYSWLMPLRRRLTDPATAVAAASQIKARDLELDAMLHTTVSFTMAHGGFKNNVIPSFADGWVFDVRRMPNEKIEDVLTRFRQIINDPEVEVGLAPGQQMPATEPSSVSSPIYVAMQHAIAHMYPRDIVVPYMSRGATDGSFLRAKGMGVYGAPIFLREGESRAHGNDERISPKNLEDGVELLWQIVLETVGAGT